MKAGVNQARPHIVLILADDLGFSDLGCYGGEIRPPRLDGLAREGARYSEMYNCARCCPSRASLLTGLYPHQAGIGHMVRNLGIEAYQGYLSRRCVTIAEVLRDSGYQTYLCGKWHVGGHYTTCRGDMGLSGSRGFPLPSDRGFDHFYGTLAGAGSYYNPHSLMEDGQPIRIESTDFYYTDAISTKAVGMIEKASLSQKPFFLYVSYTAPHWPLHAREEDIVKYRGGYRKGWDVARCGRFEEMKRLNLIHPSWLISPRDENAPPWTMVPDRDWEDLRMSVYAAQIERMDTGIGWIIDALKKHSILDQTMVMFLSDNGGCAELLKEDGDYDFVVPETVDRRPVTVGNDPSLAPGPADTFMSYDLPWANVSNAPFRLFKHWVHEGGISTPFIVYWREKIPGGKIVHSPAHLVGCQIEPRPL